MAEILKSLAEILDSDAPTEVVAKIEALGARVLSSEVTPDPSRAGALLAYTVGIIIPGYEFGRLEPDQLRAEIHNAWRALLSALAATAPLVVVVDDIHWADSALLDLLDDLGNRGQGAVLIMCPARPELTDRRPGWGGGRRNFSSVVLNPLPADATSQLVDQLLAVEDLPDTVHARIVERAGGNPFFVEEILRHLIDEGHIVRTDSGWRTEAGLAELEIPDTVQGVLAARIDLLGPLEKRTLQAAAVVGRVFWPAPVALFLNGSSGQLDDSLRTLEDRDLVVARMATSLTGQPEYTFKHALVRDVAYESIPRRERADAHLRVADWIEEVIGERRLEVVELLAHHYTEAQRAMSWANVPAARQDEIRSRAVTALYDAAWEAARHLNSERARERARVGLELASGPIERARGLEVLVPLDLWADDASTAWSEACEAVDLRVLAGPTTADERLAVAAGCARALEMPTRWPGLMRNLPSREEAAAYLELGMQCLPEGDSEERVGLLMAKGAWSWGFAESILDPDVIAAERKSSEEAVAMARRLGRPQLLSATLDTLGATGTLLHGYAGQMEPQAERIKLIPQLDDVNEIVDIYGTSAWGFTHIGRFREAAELGRQVMEVGEGLGILNYVGSAFRAVAQYRLGEWTAFWETAAQVEALLDLTRPLRYHVHRVYGVAAYIKEVTGDTEAADRFIERLDRSQVDLGAVGVAGARSWIVAVLARRGEFAAARERLAVVDPVRDIQNRDLTYEAWADLIATEGAWDEAPAIVAAARDWAERTGLEFLPAICDRLEGQADLVAGKPQNAIDLLTRARGTFGRLEAVWERARTDLSLAEAQLASGTDARSAIEAAQAVFIRLGASREAEVAARLAARSAESGR
jgi:hypothetical protein